MDNWQTIQELIKEINEELKALNDKPMAIDEEKEDETKKD